MTFHRIKEEGMHTKRSFSVMMALAVTAGMIFLVPAGSAMADEQVQEQYRIHSQEQVKVMTQLKKEIFSETGFTRKEVKAIQPLMAEALELNGGEIGSIMKILKEAGQDNCVGECLAERLRTQNRLMLKEQAADGEEMMAREKVNTRTHTRDSDSSTRSGSGSSSGGHSAR